MSNVNMYIDLDVHKDSIDISMIVGERDAKVRFQGTVGGDLADLEKAVRKIRKAHPLSDFTSSTKPDPAAMTFTVI